VKVLLVDRAFIDGVLLWWLWKKMKIHFVIPARSNMEVSQDLRVCVARRPMVRGSFGRRRKRCGFWGCGVFCPMINLERRGTRGEKGGRIFGRIHQWDHGGALGGEGV